MSPELAAQTVSVSDASELVGLSARRLQQLAAEGWIPKAERGVYLLVGLVQGVERFRADERSRASKSAAGSRVSDARAAEIEMRIEERSRALVDEAIREALGVIDEYAGPLRSDMLSIPPRLTNDLALRRRMEVEILAAFGAAARRASAAAELAEASPLSPRPNRATRRRGARHGLR